VAAPLQRTPGGRLLDLGSGAGRLARYLAGDAAHYALADVSPHLLDAARTRLGSGRPFTYTALTGATLPFTDGSFNACLAVDVVVHLPEAILRGWFAEVARVLVPGGRFLLTAGVPPAVGSIDFGPSRQLLRLLNLRPVPFGARTGAVLARMLADGPLHPIGQGEDFPNLLPVLGVQAPFAGYWLLFERP
jgi:ubiquinone/menaquinone biosynthesis C-methylase UbiE